MLNLLLIICFISFYITIAAKFITLKPLKAYGFYSNSISNHECYYLSRGKLEVLEGEDDNTMRLCDVVPIPFKRIANSDQSFTSTLSFGYDSTVDICNRDNGIYDNLPYKTSKTYGAKKGLYDFLSYESNRLSSTTFPTPSHKLQWVLKDVLDVEINKLYIDVIDEYESNTYQLGGALSLASLSSPSTTDTSTTTHEAAIDTSDNSESNNSQVQSGDDSIINVHLDELMNLAFDLDLPVYMSRKLYDQCR